MVRRSGPVQSMKFKSWWVYFLFLVLVLMLAGLGAGSYLLYRQQTALQEISEDTRLLMLRAERLEALVQEQETRALLIQQEEEERRQALVDAGRAEAEPKPSAEASAQEAPAEAAEEERSSLPPEPRESDRVGIANVKLSTQGRELVAVFDVTNEMDPDDPAMGYVTVVARARRGAKPWIEAWPPQRLTPLGRPLNSRRGTPFSVQRFRRLKAKFAKGDKDFHKLEFLVYSREGDLLLVHQMDLNSQDEAAGPGAVPGVTA
jgi:hypothetical protein